MFVTREVFLSRIGTTIASSFLGAAIAASGGLVYGLITDSSELNQTKLRRANVEKAILTGAILGFSFGSMMGVLMYN